VSTASTVDGEHEHLAVSRIGSRVLTYRVGHWRFNKVSQPVFIPTASGSQCGRCGGIAPGRNPPAFLAGLQWGRKAPQGWDPPCTE